MNASAANSSNTLASRLGLAHELTAVQSMLEDWIAGCDEEFHEVLRFQFAPGSKCLRALSLLSCDAAMRTRSDATTSADVLLGAVAIEIAHNATLIVDDILDRSETRRGKPTVVKAFGELSAHMVAGYMMSDLFRLLRNETFAHTQMSALFKRLAVAENRQWRLRKQPLGVTDWRQLAREDTGSMFEACANLATGSTRLGAFGNALGMLYHGCDDVADLRGSVGLGGGGDEDIRDGILTLPAALALTDPAFAERFAGAPEDRHALRPALEQQLSNAEQVLDELVVEARAEAQAFAHEPERLYALVQVVRELSR
jgi:geranylgeranyl pyrophosphate synthase